jgi:hypothetical protein
MLCSVYMQNTHASGDPRLDPVSSTRSGLAVFSPASGPPAPRRPPVGARRQIDSEEEWNQKPHTVSRQARIKALSRAAQGRDRETPSRRSFSQFSIL